MLLFIVICIIFAYKLFNVLPYLYNQLVHLEKHSNVAAFEIHCEYAGEVIV